MERRRRESDARLQCPACGEANAVRARFCDQCGRPLGAGARAGALAARAEPGDRRIVTALFADIVDYSRLVSELDPEEVAARIEEAFGLMAGAVQRYGGIVEKFIGDAVFALFGARGAHDDDAVRAALCSIEMTATLDRAAAVRGEASLRLRVGIATGEVVAQTRSVGEASDLAVTGETVTTAMRLQELADPGETLLDEASVRAARNRLEVEVVGERRVRGRSTPVRISRLRGERLHRLVGGAGHGLLIGRAADRARLRETLEATRRTGRGHVVVVIGDAGIGKTRLVADLEEEARGLGFAWTWIENLSYTTGESYGFARMFAQRVADEAGTDSGAYARRLLFSDDIDEASARRFAGGIAAVARDAAFSGWEAEAALVPADPAEIRHDLGEVSERYVRRLVELAGPRALVIDDLHWMDASSEPLVDRLLRTVADLPMTVFVTTRPTSLPPWAENDHVETMTLAGLDTAGTERLAASIAGAELDDEAIVRLHDRTAGNPLFVGETVRALLEDDALVTRAGRLHLRDADGVGRVPVNLRALLGARIDGLPAGSRWILQVASVVGMTFEPALVALLMGRSSVEAPLAALAAAAVVGPTEGSTEWRFRHPLIRDVAYASTLASRRRDLHGKLADHLEGLEPPPPIGTLAQHRAAAGDRERAVPLLEQAADAALAVGAVVEAVGYWRTALVLLGDDPGAAPIRDRVARLEAPGSASGARTPA
ncbi:MAG TPA: adenylate/guanylate cyclase domain-containing protein [Candidatus Limnocylindrales bacterium]